MSILIREAWLELSANLLLMTALQVICLCSSKPTKAVDFFSCLQQDDKILFGVRQESQL